MYVHIYEFVQCPQAKMVGHKEKRFKRQKNYLIYALIFFTDHCRPSVQYLVIPPSLSDS